MDLFILFGLAKTSDLIKINLVYYFLSNLVIKCWNHRISATETSLKPLTSNSISKLIAKERQNQTSKNTHLLHLLLLALLLWRRRKNVCLSQNTQRWDNKCLIVSWRRYCGVACREGRGLTLNDRFPLGGGQHVRHLTWLKGFSSGDHLKNYWLF